MRLLIIEDEQSLLEHLQAGFKKEGFAVDTSTSGKEGLFLGKEADYDAAIIDLGLPELDGLDVIRELRAAGQDYPIIVLTARGHWRDKVDGLESGADDYLAKPFIFDELLARVKALLRRSVGMASSTLTIGLYELDTSAKSVRVDGRSVELTSYEYNTLEYLMTHKNKVVSKTELTEHLYEQDYDRDSNVIEVFIRRLRKKLDPDGERNPILTQRGLGYRFNADVN
ncbi:response regulator transcription factor [Reinekea blandensis]|uniref:Response regulator consisting of a CheY-like receiver domain and a winged-helix DNA-binding domain n=1 Tax=Reinekea blandensis MED297 TaxID=314283 RepID=A4BBN0_9GAMM|nr:response regulator transcription factor [Reinekea blandensis]EAR10365.1 Response regulator consisting of a CheY-like receiver domain and a winged-helix DNA-binding domain [Reinekea sp. MED297] [Reinekea blandensis MED297]